MPCWVGTRLRIAVVPPQRWIGIMDR